MNFTELRNKYPQYNDMSDEDLAKSFHKKYYSDLSFDDFAGRIGYNPMSGEDIISRIKSSAPENRRKLSAGLLGAVSALDSGRTFGFGRKAGGVLNAAATAPVDWIAQALGAENVPTRAERYREIVEPSRQAEQEFYEANPVTGTALNIYGAIKNPANVAAANYAAKAPTLLAKIGKGTAVGAGTGAVNVIGQSESPEELIDNAVSGVSSGALINGGLPLVGAMARIVGKGASKALGMTTGAGGKAIEQAYDAGKRGSQAFKDNMRGNVGMSDAVDEARFALGEMKQAKNAEYARNMDAIKQDQTVLDLAPVTKKIKELKDSYKSGNFSKAGKDTQKALNEVEDVIEEFQKNGTPNADGFDALKQRIQDITFPYEAREANRVISLASKEVKNAIAKQAPVYSKIMKQYSQMSDEIQELEKGLSLGRNKTVDTALRKLQSVFRNNVSSNYGNRGSLLEVLQNGKNNIADALAGQSLNSFTPRGLLGGSLGGGLGLASVYTNPSSVIAAPAFSPRTVGEAAYGLGAAAQKINKMLGRVPDIDVLASNPAAAYIAYLNSQEK